MSGPYYSMEEESIDEIDMTIIKFNIPNILLLHVYTSIEIAYVLHLSSPFACGCMVHKREGLRCICAISDSSSVHE